MKNNRNEIRSLVGPNKNVAEEEIIAIQDAVTKIKEAIVRDVNDGISKEATTRAIRKIIKELSLEIKDLELAKEVSRGLAISVQRWYYTYSTNITAINVAYKNNFIESFNLYKETGSLGLKKETYTVDIQFMLSELSGSKTANQIAKQLTTFRPYLDESSKGLPIIKDYNNAVNQQIKVLASDPPVINRLTKEGKPYKVNMRNRAEMRIRYIANRQDIIRLHEEGIKLVWTSSHPDASPRCSPYQGKLWSLDGTTGIMDGIPYEPIDDALKGPLGDGNGIINGYNCRHRLIEYTKGSRSPKEYTQEELRREYAIDQKQRYYENRIRLLKTEERLTRALGDIHSARTLRRRWRNLNKKYEQYSLENGRAFYRWRTIVSRNNQDQNLTLASR